MLSHKGAEIEDLWHWAVYSNAIQNRDKLGFKSQFVGATDYRPRCVQGGDFRSRY